MEWLTTLRQWVPMVLLKSIICNTTSSADGFIEAYPSGQTLTELSPSGDTCAAGTLSTSAGNNSWRPEPSSSPLDLPAINDMTTIQLNTVNKHFPLQKHHLD